VREGAQSLDSVVRLKAVAGAPLSVELSTPRRRDRRRKRPDPINRKIRYGRRTIAKTPLEALQVTLSRLKEMEHYSQTNIEKLSALWLEVSEHEQQRQYERMVDEVLKRQNQFQESIAHLIEAYESETSRLRAAAESKASG
jgi:hypothetical protein